MMLKQSTQVGFVIFLFIIFTSSCNSKKEKNAVKEPSENIEFNSKSDLLLLNYDCKTDVDDLHSVAAAGSLIRIPQFSKLNYHAVAGSYGVQDGKYVPANSLFNLAFHNFWSDAHTDFDKALNEVFEKAHKVLKNGGNIWIAEAGQSDFSFSLISKIQYNLKQIDTKKRIHIVQHSDWNEETTTSENLTFVKQHSNYQKIPDGNILDNGTPGFNTSNHIDYRNILDRKDIIAIWDLAVSLADRYNGAENRYLNKSIKAGGMDFSDFSEVYYILKLKKIQNCLDYFKFIKNQN
ncbi:MAG: hypothetical protein AAF611_02030 [Bacteroidota bacterium]